MSDPGKETNRRKEQRSPSYLGGRLTFSQQNLSADCVVRDQSEGGALLFVDGAERVPDAFDLTIAKTKTAYRVRTRWRRNDALGVEITAQHTGPAAPPDAFEADRIRRLRAENERLRRRLRQLEE
ncbi:MAG: PilZ domain-containing protein [Rhodoplanes sp.]|uniref:PilZ domain-containing protein n=1 Tax=Rhodoplanes sp. TaxID=1968906 RepID=UPI00179953DE|nr:PilZ domain-containing protein [Rhodoplanes sp.]NVO14120.1 PilZ domain-containing protein [Rhodoplanes sp.]